MDEPFLLGVWSLSAKMTPWMWKMVQAPLGRIARYSGRPGIYFFEWRFSIVAQLLIDIEFCAIVCFFLGGGLFASFFEVMQSCALKIWVDVFWAHNSPRNGSLPSISSWPPIVWFFLFCCFFTKK